MNTEEKIIELQFECKDYAEIYSSGKYMNLLEWRGVKRQLLGMIVSLILTFFFFLFSYKYPELSFLIVLSVLLFLTFAILITITFFKFYKYKNQVKVFLNEIAKSKVYKFSLGETFIEWTDDRSTRIDKWGNIKKASISDELISLTNNSDEQYLIPTKSMDPEKYKELGELVKSRIKAIKK
jgi:hypothetical protein